VKDKMPKQIATAVCGGLALLMTVVGCQKHEITRVKLEVIVEDDGKTYRGSSVQQYSCRESTHIMSDSAHCSIKGEAVVVKIGDKGDLFMVIDHPNARSGTTMVWSILGAVSKNPMTANNSTLPKSWSLRTEQMPLMVRFSNPSDAYSVVAVDPDDLDKSFGSGVRLVSVNVSTTSDPVEYGNVERQLPWIFDRPNPFQRNTGENPLSENFAYTTFISGDFK
jgi:hypothetical protein